MYRRIVLKLGTSVLTGGSPRLDQAHMVELVRQCAMLHRQGRDVILCTSGAIAAGREQLGFPDAPDTLAHKQMLAAVGQSRLMHVWERLFHIYGLQVGQMLLTRADVDDRNRFLNARDTIQTLLEYRIVPVVNENDAVATAEIRVGDNDNLSALVAVLAGADLLVLLTDQPGLFTADPREDAEARLIPEVDAIDASLVRLAGGSVSGLGVGGMATKLQAADTARKAGVDVVIASGHAPDVIRRVVDGEPVGTRFAARASPVEGRKRWIMSGVQPSGRLSVDEGAERALRQGTGSLLTVGISRVEGVFPRGGTVMIADAAGREFARGLVRYNSEALDRIRGCRSDDISQVLSYTYGPVAVHRNDLILL